MVIISQIIRSFILGIIAAIVLAVLSIGTLFFESSVKSEMQYSMAKVEKIYTENEVAFSAVQTYIGNFDLSPYKIKTTDRPYFSILRPNTLPEDSKYTGWITTNKTIDVIIDDDTVNTALDQLFRSVGIIDIIQTNDESARSIYFYITHSVGLVHSKSGDVPADYPDEMGYTFQRINDNWFYWKHKG
jgi:hypothetical protein